MRHRHLLACFALACLALGPAYAQVCTTMEDLAEDNGDLYFFDAALPSGLMNASVTLFLPVSTNYSWYGIELDSDLIEQALPLVPNFVLPTVYPKAADLLSAGTIETNAGSTLSVDVVAGKIIVKFHGLANRTATLIPMAQPYGKSMVYQIRPQMGAKGGKGRALLGIPEPEVNNNCDVKALGCGVLMFVACLALCEAASL